MNVFTLSGALALTKSYSLDHEGNIVKSPYPNLGNFTSTKHTVATIRDLYVVIQAASNAGHCLLKGELSRDLHNESRAGTTDSMGLTQWLCLDLDDTDFDTPEEFTSSVEELKDVSYVIQYSASYGITMNKMGCHIFILLSAPMKANLLKIWLKHLNFKTPRLRDLIKLTKSNAALSWPLDVTTCQNDKLLYITKPHLGKGIKSTYKGERIILVEKSKPCLDIKLISYPSEDALNKQTVALRNELRGRANLPLLKHKIKNINGLEVQPGLSSVTVTGGPHTARGFVYFNFNGGDSWGYYHPEGDFEHIRNFKGEPSYLTKDIMPDYYAECVEARSNTGSTSSDGSSPFVFRDLFTASFWNGFWFPSENRHELYPARNERQLEHFMLSNNRDMGDYVPVYRMVFDPNSDIRLDLENEIVNTWQPSPLFQAKLKPLTACGMNTWPVINYIFRHAIGKDEDLQAHWHQWLGFIIQYREKTQTAWLWSGTEGTGKGFIVNYILRPIFEKHLIVKHAPELKSQFNTYLKESLLAIIDEIDITKMDDASSIESTLKNFITEPMLSVRAMFQDSVPVRNYTSFIFTTNLYQGMALPANDRRHNIGERQEQMLPIVGGSFEAMKQMVAKELPFFFSYLAQIEIDVDRVHKPFLNQARRDLIDLSKSTADMVAIAITSGDIQFLLTMLPDNATMEQPSLQGTKACAYNDLVKNLLYALSDPANKSYARIFRDELFVIFDYLVGGMSASPTKFTQYCNHKGIKLKPTRWEKTVRPGVEIQFGITPQEAQQLIQLHFPGAKKLMRIVK
jgi:hypothetical protein